MKITQEIIDKIILRAREYGAQKLILFGSALESPEDANDIDIACDIPGIEIFLFAGRIEEELRISIDVIPLTPTNPFVEHISKYGKVLYDRTNAS